MTTFYSTEMFTFCEDICREAYGISYEQPSECRSYSQSVSEKVENFLFGDKSSNGTFNSLINYVVI